MVPWDGEAGNLELFCIAAARDKDKKSGGFVDQFAAQVGVPKWKKECRKHEMWLRASLAARCDWDPFVSLRNVFSEKGNRDLISLSHVSFKKISRRAGCFRRLERSAGFCDATVLNARSNSRSSVVTPASFAASLNRLNCSLGSSSGSLRLGMKISCCCSPSRSSAARHKSRLGKLPPKAAQHCPKPRTFAREKMLYAITCRHQGHWTRHQRAPWGC